MKVWKKIISLIVLLGVLGIMGYTVIAGWPGTDGKGKASNINLGLDLAGGVSITYQTVGDVTSQELSDAVYKMQQRIDEYDGAQAYAEGSNRVTVEIPGADDATTILEELGKPGAIYFILEYTQDGKTQNYKWETYINENGQSVTGYHLLRNLEDIEKDGSLIMTGSDIKTADAVYTTDNYSNNIPVVSFVLKDESAQKFTDATKLAHEEGWTLGIYYNDEFISVPSVENEISGGSGIINGFDTIEEARILATNIRIGALPVELEEISSQVVGATLGQGAIKTSLLGAAIGFIILFIFMIVIYRIPGVAANIALLVYTAAELLILNVFNLTLTLPGIAGIVLSVGMAVDANVIIYSRIKEELAAGMGVRGAIKNGYNKALSAIVDGNVTTLIAAVILGILGTGPVRGFAITLGIGIVLSMIASLLVSRWVLLLMYHLGCKNVKLYGVAKERKTINFLGKRKLLFSISGLVIATGLVFLVVNGATGKGIFNFDLEFSGGTSTSITFNEEYTLEEIEDKVIPVIKDATGVKTVQQQKVKNSNTVIFKTQMLDLEKRTALNEALEKEFGIDTSDKNVVSSENISATVSTEMRRDAVVAVAVATVLMLLYIWIRFKDVKFATSAIIALLHDILVVIAFYAISRTNVGNTFIACLLTILGYSINATIVIFDRIREEMEISQKDKLIDVVNRSITVTLSRSINTSLTTFIMIFVLYIVGVSSIKEFAAPIMVGIIAGAYSSVCLSGALWFMMKKASIKRAIKKAE